MGRWATPGVGFRGALQTFFRPHHTPHYQLPISFHRHHTRVGGKNPHWWCAGRRACSSGLPSFRQASLFRLAAYARVADVGREKKKTKKKEKKRKKNRKPYFLFNYFYFPPFFYNLFN
jgi:hypothetical protein